MLNQRVFNILSPLTQQLTENIGQCSLEGEIDQLLYGCTTKSVSDPDKTPVVEQCIGGYGILAAENIASSTASYGSLNEDKCLLDITTSKGMRVMLRGEMNEKLQ